MGLDELARRLYRLRAEHPRLGDSDAACRLDVPLDDLLARQQLLVDLHLVHELTGGGWAVRSPDVAADQVLADDEQRLAEINRRLAGTRAELGTLTGDYLEARRLTSLTGQLEDLEGVEQVRVRIQDLSGLASVSIDNMAPGGGHTHDSIDAALPLDLAALDRQVSLRSLFQHPARSHVATNRYLRKLTEAGAQVRSAAVLPTRMIIYDGAVAVLPVQHAVSGVGAVVVRHPGVLAMLRSLFDSCWQESAAFTVEAVSPGADRPSDLQLAVVRLLAAGKKDEVIAHQTGLSVRTIRRIVAETMSQLGARSRFEAGVQVMARGWLPVSPPGP